ncbi:MAG: DNA gyrase subunit A [Candidatus Bruticola sp.]
MENRRQIVSLPIEDGMKEAYVDYAMSVIIARALPDVRDGFKPVHRRIIYTMFEERITPDKKFRKSASAVGNVLARYHPHGDSSVYDAMVRLAQPFNTRYPLISPQGNFGSIDGDSAAHMRYTEAKLSKISMEMIRDLGKNTVDWRPNFDNSTQEPIVLPALLPNLIVNGSEGIAVGMATKIPPHNLREIVNGILAYLENPNISTDELMLYIPGPDFPTGAIICGQNGIKSAYSSGRGSIKVRSVTSFEEVRPGKQAIVVTEIPYQVNKAKMVEEIAAKVNDGTITGITDLRDESSREGIRIVIELAANANAKVVLNRLFTHTRLQSNYSVIMLALVNDVPRLLTLKEIISCYVDHRRSIISRRTQYELDKALARDHIVQAILKSLNYIDEIIELIETSADVDSARVSLMKRWEFSEIQAQAVLDMRLQKLTGLEYDKFAVEHDNLLKTIFYCQSLLNDVRKIDGVLKEELLQLQARYSDGRRTRILSSEGEEIDIEDLISNEQMVVTLSSSGYAKRVSLSQYRTQGRGGRGRSSLKLKADDSLEQLFTCRAHDVLLFFTNKARVYRLKVYELPSNRRVSMGTALVNLLNLEPGEKVVVAIPFESELTEGSIITITRQGYVKRTSLSQFLRVPSRGKKALLIKDGDELETAIYSAYGLDYEEGTDFEGELSEKSLEVQDGITSSESLVDRDNSSNAGLEEDEAEEDEYQDNSTKSVFVVTKQGRVLRFSEDSVRRQGRTARGVLSMSVREGDSIVALGSDTHGTELIIITENGFGKRMKLSEFSIKGRRGQGVIGLAVSDKIGTAAAALIVNPQDQIMISTANGIVVRTAVSGISLRRRNSGGVKVISLSPGDKVIGAAYVVTQDEKDNLPFEEELEGVVALGTEESDVLDDDSEEKLHEYEDYNDFYENLPEEDFIGNEEDSFSTEEDES